MSTPFARVGITVLTFAAVLTGCAESPTEPAGSPSISDSPTGAETAPEPGDAEPSDEASTAPESGDDASGEATETLSDGDLDEVDGVRTNTFMQLPQALGDMTRVSSQSDPSVHGVVLVYASDDQNSGMQFKAQFASVGGEHTPLSGTDDEIFDNVLERAESLFAQEESRAFPVDGGEYAWHCLEATRARGSDEDHSLCLTVAYGRIIDVEYLTQHDEDAAAREDNLSALLGEISDGLVALG